MEYKYEELSHMTVVQLREIGHVLNHPDLHGINTMHKDKLLPLLCKVLGVPAHAHAEIQRFDKSKVKSEIRMLKKERLTALEAKDHEKLHQVRVRIHRLKRLLRRELYASLVS